MRKDGWRYYNHALMPDTPPHVPANLSAMKDNDFWKNSGGGFRFLRVGLQIGIADVKLVGGML